MRVLVLDIGGTFTKYACMDEAMRFLERGKIPTPQDSRESLIEALGQIYDGLLPLDGIALAMPGIIDPEQGCCRMGGALRYNDGFFLRQALYRRCPVRICMENDAKCAALAEAAAGSLQDVDDGFVLIFGTMIGGGYIKDRKLHRGRHCSAGEVSYIVTSRDSMAGPDTIWGTRCGTPYLCRLYAERIGADPREVDGVQVFEAVARQDPDALDCLERFTKEIAVQIFNLQTVLDVERFAIGGGISAQPAFLQAIRDQLQALYRRCPYTVPQAEVVACAFQNDANLIGALQCFFRAYP